MMSKQHKRLGARQYPIYQWTTQGYSGASPSRDIPVLPLISHPLKTETSDLISILTNGSKMQAPTLPTIISEPSLTDVLAVRSKSPVYYDDDIRYFSHLLSTQSTPGPSIYETISDKIPQKTERCSGSAVHAHNRSSNRLLKSWKRHSSPSASKDISNQMHQQAKIYSLQSGPTIFKGTPKELSQTPKRHSGTSKDIHKHLPHSTTRNFSPSTSKDKRNHPSQSLNRTVCSSTAKGTSSCNDGCAPQKPYTVKSKGYPWHDVPLISHDSLKVTGGILEPPRKATEQKKVVSKTHPPPKRHPTTNSHMYYLSDKKRLDKYGSVQPPLSLQSLTQKPVAKPPKVVVAEKSPKPSTFKMMYFGGELPIRSVETYRGTILKWTTNIDDLDYGVFLPVFFEGLRYKERPWCIFARQGCTELIKRHSSRVLETVDNLVTPIQEALETRNKTVFYHTLKVVQTLMSCDPQVGMALIPQIYTTLPIIREFLKDRFAVDEVENGLKVKRTLGDVIDGFLRAMDEFGGEDAYDYIKLIVPTYVSPGFPRDI